MQLFIYFSTQKLRGNDGDDDIIDGNMFSGARKYI